MTPPLTPESGKLTLETAREHVGHGVVYLPCGGPVEDGVITSVGECYVFVRYDGDQHPKATRPDDLILLAHSSGPTAT